MTGEEVYLFVHINSHTSMVFGTCKTVICKIKHQELVYSGLFKGFLANFDLRKVKKAAMLQSKNSSLDAARSFTNHEVFVTVSRSWELIHIKLKSFLTVVWHREIPQVFSYCFGRTVLTTRKSFIYMMKPFIFFRCYNFFITNANE